MLKKRMKYMDFEGNEREEDFFFNLTKAELMEMEMSTEGGLVKYVEKLISIQDATKIVKIFKDLILKSYGEKSLDGKRFIKSKELSDAFSQTEAYSDLFMELATNAGSASDFINGLISIKPELKK